MVVTCCSAFCAVLSQRDEPVIRCFSDDSVGQHEEHSASKQSCSYSRESGRCVTGVTFWYIRLVKQNTKVSKCLGSSVHSHGGAIS